MVGGNIEGETRTVSIDIYDEVQALNYAGAAKTALLLLVVSYRRAVAGLCNESKGLGGMAAALTVDCRKTFPGRFTTARSWPFRSRSSTVLILFGPSGSGKTTCYVGGRAGMAGRGTNSIGLDNLDRYGCEHRVSPQARHIGYMAQDYALFPTHTVTGNIEYGLSDLPTAARQEACP